MSENERLINLYSSLDLEDKRKELNNLIKKTAKSIESILKSNNINQDIIIKNYNTDNNINEDEMLEFIYDDLWNLKNYLLVLESLLKTDNTTY